MPETIISENFQESHTTEQLMLAVRDLEDLVRNHQHRGYDNTPRLYNTLLSAGKLINNLILGDTATFPGTLTLNIAPDKGDTFIKAGTIADGDFSNAGAGNGFIIGIDDSDSDKVKFYFGTTSNNIVYDGSTLTVTGTLSVSSLNIPDSTTANSMHVETDGDTYWGVNVASGFAAAPARIGKDGAAVFTSIQIGGSTVQFTVTDAGNSWFGDGSDGDVTISVNTTLTGDKFYNNLTVNAGVQLHTGQYRVFVKGTLTINGVVCADGNAGGNGGNGTNASANNTPGSGGAAGTAGAALAAGYFPAGIAGIAGTAGGPGRSKTADPSGASSNASNGNAGGSNALGVNGAAGVRGGNGGNGNNQGSDASGTAGSAGAIVASANVQPKANVALPLGLDVQTSGATVKYTGSAGTGGSSGGAGGQRADTEDAGAGGGGGGGGGSGSSGGMCWVFARNIVIGASGRLSALGGAGGNGGNGGNAFCTTADQGAGGGGGGAPGSGGSGGALLYAYNTLINNGTISVGGGAAGVAGTGGSKAQSGTPVGNPQPSNGSNGATGNTGTTGSIYAFQLSL